MCYTHQYGESSVASEQLFFAKTQSITTYLNCWGQFSTRWRCFWLKLYIWCWTSIPVLQWLGRNISSWWQFTSALNKTGELPETFVHHDQRVLFNFWFWSKRSIKFGNPDCLWQLRPSKLSCQNSKHNCLSRFWFLLAAQLQDDTKFVWTFFYFNVLDCFCVLERCYPFFLLGLTFYLT